MFSAFTAAFTDGVVRLKTSIRRRPRTFVAASLLFMILGLVGGGSLAVVSTSPPTSAAQPAFTVLTGWTLAELYPGAS